VYTDLPPKEAVTFVTLMDDTDQCQSFVINFNQVEKVV
jgi:hypothetical protein